MYPVKGWEDERAMKDSMEAGLVQVGQCVILGGQREGGHRREARIEGGEDGCS